MTWEQSLALANDAWGPDPWIVWLFALEIFYEQSDPEV